MSFKIDKDLFVRQNPFEHGLELTILNKVEEFIKRTKGITISLFYVTYKEMKSTKLGYRMFHIQEGFTARDKD